VLQKAVPSGNSLKGVPAGGIVAAGAGNAKANVGGLVAAGAGNAKGNPPPMQRR
jgi:hypothetical protein